MPVWGNPAGIFMTENTHFQCKTSHSSFSGFRVRCHSSNQNNILINKLNEKIINNTLSSKDILIRARTIIFL
ncbi:penicillin-binding protein [Yersinia similis]|uniref:Penicillin-binding protein n=1 Tax=Yersinia similis TaxID=367190 RepID=A0ABN4CT66_9GAMM|nr:penicillin-binding protein [Yersinia similis]